jgi:hypothetical protein
MEYLSFILYTLIFISILTPVAIVIFEFFDLKFEVYGNYLLWFIALALFNAILPFKTKNIFGDIAKPIDEIISKVKSTTNDFIDSAAKTAEKYKLPPGQPEQKMNTVINSNTSSEPLDIKDSLRNFIKPKLDWFNHKMGVDKPKTGISTFDKTRLGFTWLVNPILRSFPL